MYKLLKLNLARNSLRYILKTYNIKEIFIPYYLCDVIRHSIIKEGVKPIFYHINDNFLPDKEFTKNSFILYPNYFGIMDENINILNKKYPNLIVDNAHSMNFEGKGFASFNSIRKFLPVYCGSYLWIRNISYIPDKEEYIEAPKFEDEKIKNEIEFENKEIKIISDKLEKEILNFKIDNSRLENFFKLHKKYGEKNLLKINISSVKSPFCYPYLFKTEYEADCFSKLFESKGYTIYRYWNNLPKNYLEYKFYRNLVPIPLY